MRFRIIQLVLIVSILTVGFLAVVGLHEMLVGDVTWNAKTARTEVPPYDEALWFAATAAKESSNNPNTAPGDDGASRGLYQIGRLYFTDGCEGARVSIPYELGAQDPATCRTIIRGYWKKYNARTWEERSRLHNGGPRGMSKKSTIPYWLDIKERMRKLRKDG